MKANEKTVLRIAVAGLAAAAAALAVWGGRQKARAEELYDAAGEYMGAAYAVFDRCANELADNVSDMEVSLAKLGVAATPLQTVPALEDIVKSGAAAVSIMSRLPRTHQATEELMTFLVRIGDYCRCLSRRVLTGEELTKTEIDTIASLYGTCSKLTESLRTAVENGELGYDILPPSGYYADAAQEADGSLSNGDKAETVPEYPTLIYDGPFSESTEKAEAKGLGEEKVTEEEAKRTAEMLTGTRLEPTGISPGRIEVYTFGGTDGNGASVSAAVTVKGGRLLWFMRDTEGEAEGAPDEAEYELLERAAAEWLEKAGYQNMTPTYEMYYGGMALFSFVWQTGDVRVYNDLVKVWVERGTGRLIGADANNYLFSHRERNIPEPELTVDEAKEIASERLEIDGAELALIPLTPSLEALCWELHGHYMDGEFIVYINAVTGAETQIFKIINEGGGRAAV